MTFQEFRIRSTVGVMRLFGKLPLGFLYHVGDCMSWFMRSVMGYRRETVLTNLSRSFPEKKYGEIRQIENQYYRHLGEIMAEALWFAGSTPERVHRQRICEITNLEVLNGIFASSPSVTVLSSHCGNWELLGGLWNYNYDPEVDYPDSPHCIKVVYKKLRNPVSDEVFRINRGCLVEGFEGEIETLDILRYALKHRDKRFIYIYMTDQYPYVSGYDAGLFLNQRTKAMNGSVALAHKLGQSVVFLKMVSRGRGHYTMEFVPICTDASEMEVDEIMEKYFSLLEEQIRETPYDWLWSHRRWK